MRRKKKNLEKKICFQEWHHHAIQSELRSKTKFCLYKVPKQKEVAISNDSKLYGKFLNHITDDK